MLQEVLEHLHNYFLRKPNPGRYEIADGNIIPCPTMKDGQRIWIVGSDLNDGVYTWHQCGINNDDDTAAARLQDEEFNGTVGILAVPPAVIELAQEIGTWMAQNEGTINSPYQSESFNGYSYTLKSGSGGSDGGSGQLGWQDVFRRKLDRWRRLCL